MANTIPKLYSDAQKKMLPLRQRIVDAIYNNPEELTVAEVLGLLETIKLEIWYTELNN